jgi:uncharacterized integral membrane protein
VPDDVSNPQQRNVNWKFVGIGLLALVLIVFAVLNTHKVGVDYIFDTLRTPMIVVIAVSAAVGFALGALLVRHRDRKA